MSRLLAGILLVVLPPVMFGGADLSVGLSVPAGPH